MVPAKVRRVGIYARVSKADKDDPSSIPVQLADCRDRVQEEGWTVVGEYVDEGVSGWNPRVKRPRYEALLAAVEVGEVDTILVREQERLLRQLKEGVRLSDLAEAGKLRMIASTLEGDLDLVRARDRKDFRDRVSSAVFYSDFLSEKIRRTHKRKREQGEWKGGGTRPFGYKVVGPKPFRLEVDEAEAKLIRRAAQDFLAGRGLRGICTTWNAAGVRTATGRTWTGPRLGQVLGSPHLAGLRDDGSPAGIPALLDQETSRDVRDLLADPERKKYVVPRTRRHFLVGIARCVLCGTRMTAHPSHRGARTYVCRKGYDGTGCGRMRVNADGIEELVGTQVYNRWEREQAEEPEEPTVQDGQHEAIDLLRELERRLEELARDYYGDRILSRDEYLAAKRELDPKVAEARGRVHTVTTPPRRGWGDLLGEVPETWSEAVKHPAFVELHAELARSYLDRVLVHPAKKLGPRFEPERVEVVWR